MSLPLRRLLAYLLAACVFTWPLPLHLDTHVWGDRFDAWTTLWLIWHLADAGPQLAAVTDQILYPLGYNLWSFGHMALQALGVPFVWLGIGLIATYNLLAIGALTFSALCADALGRRMGGGTAGGLIAAAVFAFNPLLYGELRAGCLELVAAGFVPLFLFFLIGVVERPGWRTAGKAGVVLAITGPFNWYYALFSGMLGISFVVWQAAGRRWRGAGWCVGALALGLALASPLIPHIKQETPQRATISAEQFSIERWDRSREVADGSVEVGALTDADLEDLDALQVVLNSVTLSNLVNPGFPTNPLESTPGKLAWALGLAGLCMAGRRGLPWAVIAGGFTVLTLGPYGLVDDTPPLSEWSLANPLPYLGLYNEVPLFSKAYRPYRLAVVVLTCLAALAAAGVARAGPGRSWTAVGGSVLLIAATQPHWAVAESANLMSAEVPEIYETLSDRRGALIEVPLQYQPLSVATARAQLNQVSHGRPILNCNQLIRRTDLARFRDYVQGNGLLAVLLDLARRQPPYEWGASDVDALLQDGFTEIVVRTQVPTDAQHLAGEQDAADRLGLAALSMFDEAFGEPVLDRGGLRSYVLRPTSGGRWDGESVMALDDAHAALGLPIHLQNGQRYRLWDGTGSLRQVGAWLHVVEGSVGLLLELDGVEVGRAEAAEGAWHWARVGLDTPEEGVWSLSVVGEGSVRLARPEVRRW